MAYRAQENQNLNVSKTNGILHSIDSEYSLFKYRNSQRRIFVLRVVCEWYGFLGGVLGFNSIGSLTLIALDRYRCISRPLEMLYKATSKRALIQIFFIWIWAIVWTCPPLFGWSRYIGEGFQVSRPLDNEWRILNLNTRFSINLDLRTPNHNYITGS